MQTPSRLVKKSQERACIPGRNPCSLFSVLSREKPSISNWDTWKLFKHFKKSDDARSQQKHRSFKSQSQTPFTFICALHAIFQHLHTELAIPKPSLDFRVEMASSISKNFSKQKHTGSLVCFFGFMLSFLRPWDPQKRNHKLRYRFSMSRLKLYRFSSEWGFV